MKKTKFAMLLVMVFVLALQGAGLMPAAAEAESTQTVIDYLTVDYLFDSLGDGLHYGVVAEKFYQGGHAETSICVDELIRNCNTAFMHTETTYLHGAPYPLYATVSVPTSTWGYSYTLKGMQFGLFAANGDSLTLCEDTVVTVTEDTTATALHWKLPEDSEYLTEDLYVRRVYEDGNGNYVPYEEGEWVDWLQITYGPSISSAAPHYSYIGSMKSDWSDAMVVWNEPYCTPVEFGPGMSVYVYENGDYQDVADGTYQCEASRVYVKYQDKNGEWIYSKLGNGLNYEYDDVAKHGVFYFIDKNGERKELNINVSSNQEDVEDPENWETTGRASLIRKDAQDVSRELAKLTGGVGLYDASTNLSVKDN